MKKTATILALAGLSMAANPEQRHGAFRTRKIVDHKPVVDSSVNLQPAVLLADDELQIIRMGGGSYGNSDPRFHPSKPTKPETWTPPTNPKVWTAPPKRELYADDADDELQIIRMDSGNYGNSDPRFHPQTTKPKTWTPPTNPKYWTAPPKRELYADDADDELQIIRMGGGSYGNSDPRFHPSKPTKPETWTPPTNPKVWTAPPKRELYADDADDELQIIRMGGGSYGNSDPRFHPSKPTKPETWTPPTNPKVWTAPPKRELYADDADDELQIIRMGSGNYGNSDPRFHPQTTKPKTWTPPTNPKYWTAPPKRELYADDADDELQIIRMGSGNYGNSDPRFHPQTTKPKTWTPPTNPKYWTAPPKRELYADDADDELQIIRMDSGNYGNSDPRFHPQTSKPKPWTPPTNPKVWIAPPKRELYADDADDELQIIRMGSGSYGNSDPRFHPQTTQPKTWTPPTNPKYWTAPPKKELYADDVDDELIALAELLNDN